MTFVTFKCGACGKFNAVGEGLRGQKVRCPHCQQVVQVPGGEGEPAPPEVPSDDLSFTVRAAESDSILTTTEGVGDVLFGEEEPTATLEMPVAEPSGDEAGIAYARIDGESAPAEATDGQAAAAFEGEVPSDGAAAFAADSSALPGEDNPWANAGLSRKDLSESGHAAPLGERQSDDQAVSAAVSDLAAADLAVPDQPAARPATIAKPSASSWLLAILLPYALAATAAAVIFYLRSGSEAVHPLEELRDQGLYEEFAEGRQERVDPRARLRRDVKPVALGETRAVGALEVTPLRVTRQKLRWEAFRGADDFSNDQEALVLHLGIKNRSDRLVFHPTDATFYRMHHPDFPSYTYVEIEDRAYYGPVPVEETNTERLKGQSFEELLPGKNMETIIAATEPSAAARGEGPRNALEAIKSLDPKHELIWRVHLRIGRQPVPMQRGGQREVWMTAVVPIRFTPADVRPVP